MNPLRVGVALVIGILFGLGLSLGGMVDPAKVRGFLDVFGDWNPRLAAVMAGAIGVTIPFYWLNLVAGSLIFGVGWGLSGFCPAPSFAVWIIRPEALLFVAAVVAGMLIERAVARPAAIPVGDAG
jgi:uncharacterized membrane protein YedE/YeeE